MGLKQELNEEVVQRNCRLEKRENIFAYRYIFCPIYSYFLLLLTTKAFRQ